MARGSSNKTNLKDVLSTRKIRDQRQKELRRRELKDEMEKQGINDPFAQEMRIAFHYPELAMGGWTMSIDAPSPLAE